MLTETHSKTNNSNSAMLKPFQSINIRVGIVILVITICAVILQNIITRATYKNITGYTQEQSLQNAIAFSSYPNSDLIIEKMPEDIGKIFSAYQTATTRNNNMAAIFLDYRQFLILAILLVLIPILLTISIIVNRKVTAPIRNLISATKQLAKGNFATRTSPNKRYWDSYSLALADDFNTMASSLERLEKERKTMIADIAHELRTPITTMQLRLEAVQDGIDPLNLDLIDSLHTETELLSGLIVDLRTLSLAEAQQLTLNKQSVNINSLLNSVAARFAPLAQKKQINIDIEGTSDSYLFADAERINQVLNNLVSNAVRHTPNNGNITLLFDVDPDNITLSVINSGSALPQKELNQIFNRFYRADQGRIRAEGGSGLGLAIVKALTELHGGSVRVQNYAEDSIMFSLRLPQNYS